MANSIDFPVFKKKLSLFTEEMVLPIGQKIWVLFQLLLSSFRYASVGKRRNLPHFWKIFLSSYSSLCTCNVSDFNNHYLVITEKLLHQEYRFHKLPVLKTFSKFCYCYIDLVFKYNSTSRDLIENGIFHQYICGGVINKVKKFKSDDIPRLVKSLKNCIRKSYDLVTFCNSFRWVRFARI